MTDYELDTEYTFDCRFEVNVVACDWGDIEGNINDQTDLKDALDNKADVETVNGIDERLGTVEGTIDTYGNIVTHDTDEFATAEQGTLADTSLQPNDNVSELVNDAGYITSSALPTVNNSKITIQKNGTKVEDFTLNQSTDKSINITVPTQLSELGTETQMSAINSGMNSTLAGQITTNQNAISLINGKIPEQASASNQLADKNFVNSSISTNTANFIGTFNSVADLEAYSGTLTNNDYAFVIGTDGDGNTIYNRYKYTTATTPASWIFEYALNNSSFTANQWASINSGANTTNINQIATNTNAITLINTTIGGYGNIVTHDASEFATAQQGSLADTSLQPNDNISELVNDAGYTSNIGTVTKVNNTLPDANGNVSLTIPPAQVQADWDETDNTSKAYIQNKPTIPAGVIVDQTFDGTSSNAQSGSAILPVLYSSKAYNDNGQTLSDTILYNNINTLYTNATITGTDTYYTDDYTVVGSPTITDGVASGFGNTKYITSKDFLASQLATADSWMIEFYIITPANFALNGGYQGIMGSTNSNRLPSLQTVSTSGGGLLRWLVPFNNSQWNIDYRYTDTFAVSTRLGIQQIFTGTQYQLKTKLTTDADWKSQYTYNSTTKINNISQPFGFGGISESNNYFTGSIDLYSIKIYINGRLVYTPKLAIPYHKTNNDILIADEGYRDKAIMVGDKYGYSPYFTLDTTNQNVTLPMPDLYSYINKSTPEYLKTVSGYDGTATQTLKNINGVLTWVTD